MKDSASVTSKPLTVNMNSSISQGCVPHDWKIARVMPLLKGSKTFEMDNYRPISILSTASKVLGKAIQAQLCHFLTTNNFPSPFQCRFRKDQSTEFVVIGLTDSVRRSMDQGLLTESVFIDSRKTSVTVDHSLLIEKLSRYGIIDKVLEWFTDYLQNCEQVVQFGNAHRRI